MLLGLSLLEVGGVRVLVLSLEVTDSCGQAGQWSGKPQRWSDSRGVAEVTWVGSGKARKEGEVEEAKAEVQG